MMRLTHDPARLDDDIDTLLQLNLRQTRQAIKQSDEAERQRWVEAVSKRFDQVNEKLPAAFNSYDRLIKERKAAWFYGPSISQISNAYTIYTALEQERSQLDKLLVLLKCRQQSSGFFDKNKKRNTDNHSLDCLLDNSHKF